MPRITGKNFTALCILKILEQYSDCDHPLTHSDIIKYLKSDYDINAERKSVGRILTSLRDEMEIDIESNNHGSWIATRDFENYELRLLIDSVMSNKYVSKDDTKEIVEKLCGLSNKYFKAHMNNIIVMDQADKVASRDLFFNLETVSEAIETRQSVSFMHYREVRGKYQWVGPITVLPVCIVFMKQKYHLVRKVERRTKTTFEMFAFDQIDKLQIVDAAPSSFEARIDKDDRNEIIELASLEGNLVRNREHIRFYATDAIIEDIKAVFGKDATIIKCSQDSFEFEMNAPVTMDVTVKTDRDSFLEFALRNIGAIKVISPAKYENWIYQQLKHGVRLNKGKGLHISEADAGALAGLTLRSKIALDLPILLGNAQCQVAGAREPLEWVPVRIEEDRALLITKKSLYFRHRGGEFWDDDNKLRQGLNGQFYDSVFSDDEKATILEDKYGDKVSLLDHDDIRSAYYALNCRIAQLTPVAQREVEKTITALKPRVEPPEAAEFLESAIHGQSEFYWGIRSDEGKPYVEAFCAEHPHDTKLFNTLQVCVRPTIIVKLD